MCAYGQNVGVNTATPAEKLHINGTVRTDSALVINPATALGPGAAPAVPDRVSTISISNNATPGDANALVAPANPIEGQLLTIMNLDDDPASFSGTSIAASSGVGVFQYVTGAWRLLSKSPVAAPKLYCANGTTDITFAAGGAAATMTDMSITFTPENPVVLVDFSAAGTMTAAGAGTRTNYWFNILVNGVQTKRIHYSAVALQVNWTATAKVPITVTPGVATTIAIQWLNANTGTGVAVQMLNNASTNTNFRTLLIQDGPLN